MEISKELLTELYVNQKLRQRDIADQLNINISLVNYYCQKYKMGELKSGLKYKNKNKHWSKEEIETLETFHGTCSYSKISQMLGRTENSIQTKVIRLGMGSAIDANEYLTVNELSRAIGRHPNTVRIWVLSLGLKGNLKVLAKSRKFYQIKVKDFWKWAKENKDLMAWDKYEINNLPNEPKWVAEEKKKKTDKSKNVKTRWNENEEVRLIFLYKQSKSLKEIGEELNRSWRSIDGKLVALGIKRKQGQVKWRQEETKILFDMRSKGICYREIAEELGRELTVVMKKHKVLLLEQQKSLTY